jgi:hypothetical protein
VSPRIKGNYVTAARLPALYENRRRVTKLDVVKQRHGGNTWMPGNRNVLYLVIGVLIVAVGVLSYNLYKAKQEPEGLQINVGPDGLKIKTK